MRGDVKLNTNPKMGVPPSPDLLKQINSNVSLPQSLHDCEQACEIRGFENTDKCKPQIFEN